MSSEFRNKHKKVKICSPVMSEMQEGMSWGFFDGVSQGNPPLCGVGVVLLISKEHFFKIFYALGKGSNMKAELAVMWNLLFYANLLNLRKVQVFVDSKLEFDWENNEIQIQVVKLQALLNNICSSIVEFEWSSFAHIYMELNTLADKLSKEDLTLVTGSC
jgi:ribonuclease HI